MSNQNKFKLLVVFALALSIFGAYAPTLAATSYGPFTYTTPDSSSCGGNWATDNIHRTYNASATSAEVNDTGTFVSMAGHSPGACDGHPDNGNTVGNGVLGNLVGSFDITVQSGTYNPAAVCSVATCTTIDNFMHTVYGGSVAYTAYATHWGWDYSTYKNGGWHNFSTGDFGDITGEYIRNLAIFDPGDDRVMPRAQDRLAVYCEAAKIVVYGTDASGKGFFLHNFDKKEMAAAGKNGLSYTVIMPNGENMGTISMSSYNDAVKGITYYAAWNGGKYGATGQKVFSKFFACV